MTAPLKSGCWTSRQRCMIDGSPFLSQTRGQASTGKSLRTAGSLCCEASDCQGMSRGGCCQEMNGCVCCDGLDCVDADCLDAHMRTASALEWSCQVQLLWKQVPAVPKKQKQHLGCGNWICCRIKAKCISHKPKKTKPLFSYRHVQPGCLGNSAWISFNTHSTCQSLPSTVTTTKLEHQKPFSHILHHNFAEISRIKLLLLIHSKKQ